MNKTQQIISESKAVFLENLLELLKIPSISADSKYADDVQKAAHWIADDLKASGAENVQVFPTKGHPIVYGEWLKRVGLPTVLVYGHYDVQPPDPLNLWDSPPFEPIIEKTAIHPDGAIFARGACDDKGQVYMHLAAFKSMISTEEMPCNVKFLIEGEEEVGSPNLGKFIAEQKNLLKADVVLISDTSMIANDCPSIDVGLRGLSYMEVEVTGPNRDLHSGVYGGAVANPANILAKMIASMHDENNHITIPGFYDDVEELSKEERELLGKAPFDENEYKKDLQISNVWGEKGYTTTERSSIRPTLDVNGIWGGYTGEGAKTVLPSKAFAKISMRLVPNQSSEKISKLFEDHFRSIAPDSVQIKVDYHHGGEPVVTPIDSIPFTAASMAMEKTFGKAPLPCRGGGSIPIVALFERELGLKSVLFGFGLNSDNLHSPNENYGLFNFYKGIETIPYFYHYYTELSQMG